MQIIPIRDLKNTVDIERRCAEESGPLVQNEFLQIENVRKKLVGNYIMYYLLNMEEK